MSLQELASPFADGAAGAAGAAGADGAAATDTADAAIAPEGAFGGAPSTPRVRLVVVADYCIRAAGASCARCSACCPRGAISLPASPGAPPIVDHARCNGCGICYGVCDAFSPTRLTINDLHARVRRIASTGERVYFTCKENVFPGLEVDSKVVVLPCLSMISPELWTLFLAEQIRLTVACDLMYCEDCDRAGELGAQLFPRAIEIAEERLGVPGAVLFSPRIPEKSTMIDKYTRDTEGLGRRAAFTELLVDVGQIASGRRRLKNSEVLQDYYEKRARQQSIDRLNLADITAFNELAPTGRVRQVLFPKQRMVLETIEAMPGIAGNIPVGISVTDDRRCEQFYDCVSACPTGARRPKADGSVEVEVRLCVGCGICVGACARGACSVEEATAEAYLRNGEGKE